MILHRIILLICISGSNAALKYKDTVHKRTLDLSHFLGDLSNTCFKNHSVTVYRDASDKKFHFYILKNIHPETPVLIIENFPVYYDIADDYSWETVEEHSNAPFPTEYKTLLFTYTEHHMFKSPKSFNSINTVNKEFFIMSMNATNCATSHDILYAYFQKYRSMYYYLCINNQGQPMIFTVNPFANWAPSSWTLYGIISMEYGRKLFMYFIIFQEDDRCQQLMFDRTTRLDGYRLQVAVPTMANIDTNSRTLIYRSPNNKDFKHIVDEYLREFLVQLEVALNVSVGGYIFAEDEELKSQVFVFNEVRKIKADMILGNVEFNSFMYYETLKFPSRRFHYGIASRDRGAKNVFKKIQDFHGIIMFLLTIFVLTVTFIGVWLIERRFSLAAFEILRLLISNRFETRIITLSSRILFGTIFLSFLMIQATFSGSMMNFMTLFIKQKNAESIDDLVDPQYRKIYMSANIDRLMTDSQTELLNPKLELVWDPYICLGEAIHNSSVACVDNYSAIYRGLSYYPVEDPKKGKLYVSSISSFNVYQYYSIRRQSLLKERLMIFLIQQWENGIHPYLIKKSESFIHEAHRRLQDANALKIDEVKPIGLEGLTFAFIFVGFSLFCATLCFIIELFIYHRNVRREKREKIIQPVPNVEVDTS